MRAMPRFGTGANYLRQGGIGRADGHEWHHLHPGRRRSGHLPAIDRQETSDEGSSTSVGAAGGCRRDDQGLRGGCRSVRARRSGFRGGECAAGATRRASCANCSLAWRAIPSPTPKVSRLPALTLNARASCASQDFSAAPKPCSRRCSHGRRQWLARRLYARGAAVSARLRGRRKSARWAAARNSS